MRQRETKARALRLTSGLLGLTVLAGIAGCAPASPPRAVQPARVGSEGTILSMRTVQTRASEQPLQAVLRAGGVGSDDARALLVEFIVRADDGATLSIVQPNDAGFHAGDRVVILRDDTAHLARPE